ncbi:fibronectin type III domain-containing protein [Actinoplanes sp. NBRC 101535]|uniref:fibronectin type III domain-containing protein n=1 Tax=Actinoplanes sp. NBRC 101535 TaxID=3032196 RepID=UPI0024A18733|nr:fibronectin type III domain-containing protein [Actinoplanes sp. NBRC 101535]GLX99848.1 hypothetical protein Acsp01_02280 [Actinoplanes sp. NBRC 101535]
MALTPQILRRHLASPLARVAGVATLLGGGLVAIPPTAAMAAVAVPTAPTSVTAERSSKDVRDFTVSWQKGTGPVSQYAVVVFADGKRTQKNVSATTTSLLVEGNSLQSVYQVHVASLNSEKQGSVSDEITVNPVLSGPPVDVNGSVSIDGSGITARWSPPQRAGLNPVLRYQVTFTDSLTRIKRTYATTNTRLDAPVDADRVYEVGVSAVTKDGTSITETAELGGAKASTPRYFTAIRDSDSPEQVVLNWSTPAWAGSDDVVTGYEIGSGTGTVTSWSAVGDTLTTTVPLASAKSAVYSVRALTAGGASALADPNSVDTAVKTQQVNDAYPIAASSTGSDVTVSFASNLAVSQEWLWAWLLPADGWSYRDMRIVRNGLQKAISFSDVPSGRYKVYILGLNSSLFAINGVTLFNEEIIVNDLSETVNATEAAFSAGSSTWHGIYPPAKLPNVAMTDKMSYDGATSMSVTAIANSVGQNITAGAGPARAVPVSGGKQLVVSAQGYTTTLPTQWNLGISWWDANNNQIAVSRTNRLAKVLGNWKSSGGTFTAPKNAVAASAFVEVGELLRGQTFYIDDIALRSYVPSQQVSTAGDWNVVRGQAQLSGGTVSMTTAGDSEVLDSDTPGNDISVNTQAQLTSGTGAYGVEVRGTKTSTGTTGYLVQVSKKAGSAGTVQLLQMVAGKVCASTLASATLASSFNPATAHKVTVRAAGNGLGVSLAGKQVLTVSSLSDVVTAKKCGAAPTGTAVGLSKAGDATVEFTGTVLNKG